MLSGVVRCLAVGLCLIAALHAQSATILHQLFVHTPLADLLPGHHHEHAHGGECQHASAATRPAEEAGASPEVLKASPSLEEDCATCLALMSLRGAAAPPFSLQLPAGVDTTELSKHFDTPRAIALPCLPARAPPAAA